MEWNGRVKGNRQNASQEKKRRLRVNLRGGKGEKKKGIKKGSGRKGRR